MDDRAKDSRGDARDGMLEGARGTGRESEATGAQRRRGRRIALGAAALVLLAAALAGVLVSQTSGTQSIDISEALEREWRVDGLELSVEASAGEGDLAVFGVRMLEVSCSPASIEMGLSCGMDWMCGLDPCLCGTPDDYVSCACNGTETVSPVVAVSSSDEDVLRVVEFAGAWWLVPVGQGEAEVLVSARLPHYADATQTLHVEVAPAGAAQWAFAIGGVLLAAALVAGLVALAVRGLRRRASKRVGRDG